LHRAMEWPEASVETIRAVRAWLTAEHAVRQARDRRRPAGMLQSAAEECGQDFRRWAELDFRNQCRRAPTPYELDRFCEQIVAVQA
jgi:hypothetical protein